MALYMSAFGHKPRQKVATLGARLIDAPHNIEHARYNMAHMKKVWVEAGRDLADLKTIAAIPGCVLKDGERYDSPCVKSQTGPHATIALHSLAEHFGDIGPAPPPFLAPILDKYREIYNNYQPTKARYLSNYRGHLFYLRPEEEALCSGLILVFELASWISHKWLKIAR